jgi:hypothetical protein
MELMSSTFWPLQMRPVIFLQAFSFILVSPRGVFPFQYARCLSILGAKPTKAELCRSAKPQRSFHF